MDARTAQYVKLLSLAVLAFGLSLADPTHDAADTFSGKNGWPSVEVIAVGLLSFFSMLIWAIAGLGPSIVFHIGWAILDIHFGIGTGRVLHVVLYLNIMFVLVCPIQTAALRKHINIPFTLVFGLCWIVTNIIGMEILIRYENIWMKRSIGILLGIMFIWRARSEYNITLDKKKEIQRPVHLDMAQWSHALLAVIIGLGAGLMWGMVGLTDPVLMVFALLTNVDRDEFRAVIAGGMVMSVDMCNAWYIFWYKGMFHWDHWKHYFVVSVGAMVGLAVGDMCMMKVNQMYFRRIILCLLAGGAAVLTTVGTGLEVHAVIAGGVLVVLALLVPCASLYIHEQYLQHQFTDTEFVKNIMDEYPELLEAGEIADWALDDDDEYNTGYSGEIGY